MFQKKNAQSLQHHATVRHRVSFHQNVQTEKFA